MHLSSSLRYPVPRHSSSPAVISLVFRLFDEGRYRRRCLGSSSPVHRLARLMSLHRSAFATECAGKWRRADFSWHKFQRELRRMRADDGFWASAAAFAEVSDPARFRRALIEEVFIDTHRNFYYRYQPDPAAADLKNRCFVHLEYLLEILGLSTTDEAQRMELAGNAAAVLNILCIKQKKWRRGVRVVSKMLELCPHSEYFQDRLLILFFLRYARVGMGVPFTGLLQRRILKRKIGKIEKLRERFPYRPVAFKYLSILNARLSHLLGEANYLGQAMDATVRAALIDPRLKPEIHQSDHEYLAEHAPEEILKESLSKGGSFFARMAHHYTITMWRLVVPSAPLAKGDPRPFSLHAAMQSVLQAEPTDKAALLAAWDRETEARSDLKDVDGRAVCAYLEFRLFGAEADAKKEEFHA